MPTFTTIVVQPPVGAGDFAGKSIRNLAELTQKARYGVALYTHRNILGDADMSHLTSCTTPTEHHPRERLSLEHTIARRALDVLVFRANRLLNRAKPSQKGEATLIRSTHKIARSFLNLRVEHLPADTNQGNCRRFSPIAGLAHGLRGAGQAMEHPWRANSGFSAMQKSAMAAMLLDGLVRGDEPSSRTRPCSRIRRAMLGVSDIE